MLDTFGNSAELPVVPMNSRAYALLSSVHYPGVKDQLDQIERTKAIGGNSAVEEGDMVPDLAPKDPKTNDKDGGDDAPRRSDHDHHGVEFKTIDSGSVLPPPIHAPPALSLNSFMFNC